jgi:dTDP-4-dehydrorhamnose 3,5-epimerase
MFKDGDIEGIVIRKMETYADNRGWLGELFRKDDPALNLIQGGSGFYPAMSYISATHPGVVRGPHEHKEQTDYFCFLGEFRLYLWDNRKDSPTHRNKKILENADRLIVIVPPGVVHAYKNTGLEDAVVINFPDRLYAGWNRKEKVDEIRYEGDAESPFKVE